MIICILVSFQTYARPANKRLQPTAYSVRCAPASGSG
jgi:hypothetical protein